jgi:aspartate-semialdehyde dehydrogenase
MALDVPLKPLHDAFGLRLMVVSSYQAAGGAGQSSMDELLAITAAFDGRSEELRHDGAAAEAFVPTSVFSRQSRTT